MAKIQPLIETWRKLGPAAWAECPYGFIMEDRQPITLAPWQRAVLTAWEARKGEITTLAVSNIKKCGKTCLNGILLAWRWLALPGAHFAVGNDLDQSASRQFAMISDMVKRHPLLKSMVTVGKNELYIPETGSKLTALAVDAAGNAGSNHLSASHTEAWGIVYENGIRAYEELTPPPGFSYGLPCLRIADSYAGFEGESITWHSLVDRGLAGERVSDEWPIFLNGGLLLFHMDGPEAQDRCFRGTPTQAATYYAEQAASLRPGTFERLHLNKRTTGSESFIPIEAWDACIDPAARPQLPKDTNPRLFVGVDAAYKHDSAAVVAVYYDPDTSKVVLARHRIWQPSAKDPLDLDGTIGDFLRELYGGYSVSEIRYDPFQMVDLATRLATEGLPMIEYPQTVPNLTQMGQNLFELIKGGNIKLYLDADMRRAAQHAVAVQNPRGWKISKEKASHKIDCIVALAMACLGAVECGNDWFFS